MRHTKFFLQQLYDIADGEPVAMNTNLPMNTPVMLVRIGGQMRLKRLRGNEVAHKVVQPANPEQTTLL